MSESDPSAPSAQETVADRRSEFVPVGAGGETSSAEALLITAYCLMWALIFALVAFSQRRQKKLDLRLAELETALAKLDRAAAERPKGPGGSGASEAAV